MVVAPLPVPDTSKAAAEPDPAVLKKRPADPLGDAGGIKARWLGRSESSGAVQAPLLQNPTPARCPPLSPPQAAPASGTLLATLGGHDAVAAILDASLQRATTDWRVKRFLPEPGTPAAAAARTHMVGLRAGWAGGGGEAGRHAGG